MFEKGQTRDQKSILKYICRATKHETFSTYLPKSFKNIYEQLSISMRGTQAEQCYDNSKSCTRKNSKTREVCSDNLETEFLKANKADRC